MKSIIKSFLLLTITIIFISAECKNKPFVPSFYHAGGYIIGKETCKANPDDDYWLVDLSYPYNDPSAQYGDTITIGTITYTNMIKTNQLPTSFKVIGKKVSFDFHLTNDKLDTTKCTAPIPITYKLKEMDIIASFEIR